MMEKEKNTLKDTKNNNSFISTQKQLLIAINIFANKFTLSPFSYNSRGHSIYFFFHLSSI